MVAHRKTDLLPLLTREQRINSTVTVKNAIGERFLELRPREETAKKAQKWAGEERVARPPKYTCKQSHILCCSIILCALNFHVYRILLSLANITLCHFAFVVRCSRSIAATRAIFNHPAEREMPHNLVKKAHIRRRSIYERCQQRDAFWFYKFLTGGTTVHCRHVCGCVTRRFPLSPN